MAKFLVTYWEAYSRGYEVEADTREEACQKVLDDIWEGRREAPDNCYDSGCDAEEIGG